MSRPESRRQMPQSLAFDDLTAPGPLADRVLFLLREIRRDVTVSELPDLLRKRFGGDASQREVDRTLRTLVGQGAIDPFKGTGSVVRTRALEPPVRLVEPHDTSESGLMRHLGEWLATGFPIALGVTEADHYVCKDTSHAGTKHGIWARPDFVAVHSRNLPVLSDVEISVHGFELKREKGGGPAAVFEALTQTSGTHYGHVVWQTADNARGRDLLRTIEPACSQYGIGLIWMPGSAGSYRFEILLNARPQSTRPSAIDGFLSDRLSPAEIEGLNTHARRCRRGR